MSRSSSLEHSTDSAHITDFLLPYRSWRRGVFWLMLIVLGKPCQMGAFPVPLPLSPSSSLQIYFQEVGTSRHFQLMAQLVALPQAEDHSLVAGGLKATGALLLILALILTLAFLLRRYMPNQFGVIGKKRLIQVVETVSLGEKRNLALVKVGSEHLLLGSTPSSISVLEKIQLSAGEISHAEAPHRAFSEANNPRQFGGVPGIRKSLANLKAWLNQFRLRRFSRSAQGTSIQSPSFGEILDLKTAEGETTARSSSCEVISRLAEVRRSLHVQ
jgi:flagellar protein FliO/FliZ